MTNKLANRVKVIVSGTPGTGAITLGEAVDGFQSFAAGGISNNDTVPYVIEDGAAWEIGVGTYSSTGPTLTRTSITSSSNSGSAINASSNSIVMLSPLAADLQSGTAAGNLVELDSSARIPAVDGSLITNLNVGNAASGTLAVARGGTGLTSLTAGQIPFGNGTSAFGSSSNLVWDSANSRLGVGLSAPSVALDVVGPQFIRGASSGGAILDLRADGTSGANGVTIAAGFAAGGNGPIRFNTAGSERLRIDSSGNVGIGAVPSAGYTLSISKNATGATAAVGLFASTTVQSDVTSKFTANFTTINTAASSFTIGSIRHYEAFQGTIGLGSSVTDQYGYLAGASLTGATNNFGFYSNIAAGTGRWNFYANGTAANYFAGPVQLAAGSASAPSLTAFGDTNTGVFYPAADTVAISTNGSERIRISNSGIAVGGTSVSFSRGTTNIQSHGTSAGGNIGFAAVAWVASTTNNANFVMAKSRGTSIGSHVILQSGDMIGQYNFEGSDGVSFFQAANIQSYVDGSPATGSIPGRITFSTTPAGGSAPTERIRIDSSGNVGIAKTAASGVRLDVSGSIAATTTIRSSGATSGIGYATGAGGTVTQATSRTTGVTIDKVCGQITLASAAGSSSWQSFTVTNSAVASTDTIIVNQDTGTDLYQIFVTNVAAGSFTITFATTGGTTTEQPVFGFSVIKAVAA